MAWRFREALRKAVRLVERVYPDYMLVGRNARNFYAPPETTLDLDFLVDLDDKERLSELSRLVQLTPYEPGHWQYSTVIEGIKVDLVKPPGYSLTREVIARRRAVKIEKVGTVYIAPPEELVILYIISSRARGIKDEIKALDVLTFSLARGDFDEAYFLRRCEENGITPFCNAVLSKVKLP